MSYIYLASPYSDPNPSVREARFYEVCKCAAHLMHSGEHIFSPIAHSHPISMAGNLPKGFDYWADYDRIMISHCSSLWILLLAGWRRSVGIKAEIEIAKELNKEIFHVVPDFQRETYTIEKPYSGDQYEDNKSVSKKYRRSSNKT